MTARPRITRTGARTTCFQQQSGQTVMAALLLRLCGTYAGAVESRDTVVKSGGENAAEFAQVLNEWRQPGSIQQSGRMA
jgi:hypothetical protein